MSLQADADRVDLPETGIYVRAMDAHGKLEPVDINHLTRTSLLEWLRSRPAFAEKVVLALLGFKGEEEQRAEPSSPAYWSPGSPIWEHYRKYFNLTVEQAQERWGGSR
jgi:hypothetical protein